MTNKKFMDKISEVIGSVHSGVGKKITDLTDKVEEQTNEFTAFREDLKTLQSKVLELEKRESDAKAIEMRRVLEEEVLREFCEEES